MRRTLVPSMLAFATGCILASSPAHAASVKVEPPQLQGSRPLEPQTQTSVIRDYLESWQSMQQALHANDAAKLDPDFIGVARDALGATVDGQSHSGIHTDYDDRSHDIRIVFYSPEGLSIQLIDDVEYEQTVVLKDKTLAQVTVRTRYVVVMTPSEARWQVRIFQADRS